ncbi:hypothetical protein RM151_11435 [Pantoea agglomerans]|uniref:hypothetical protein n=1 Tax=Enterobacter agglomerans TaxID=549 RepID=UPI00289ACD05|nr:hypothetical protein [Pantoea agglomerans]WNK56709.1 hypothetical protein RM151_11435 [Pantoea agglomerans]
MKIEEHYDLEEAEHILFGGVKPLMNTYAFDKVLLNSKYFSGKNTVDSFQGDCMNIGFYERQEPDLYTGEMTEWKFHDDISAVKIIDKYKLFVKGINVVIFLVQLQL